MPGLPPAHPGARRAGPGFALGAVRQDKWLCLGEPGIALEGLGDGFIQWAGRRFRVISAQPFYLGTVLSHWRAVLRPMDED